MNISLGFFHANTHTHKITNIVTVSIILVQNNHLVKEEHVVIFLLSCVTDFFIYVDRKKDKRFIFPWPVKEYVCVYALKQLYQRWQLNEQRMDEWMGPSDIDHMFFHSSWHSIK